jgi:RimJ/RimL family protein N-acetyltransferase
MSAEDHITTQRLTLHRHRLEDYAESAALWSDGETVRHIGKPSTQEESWARLLRNAGQWALLGYGSWVVRDRQTSQFAGEVGFKQFQRSLDPDWDELPEIGWVLAAWARGRGLANEAAYAAFAWADAHLNAPRVLCMIDPANAASLCVAARCGFSEISRLAYKEKPVIIFERHRRFRPSGFVG